MKLRVSEVYPSIQGEGLNIGKPTLFVRFAGCNLKCPLWPCDTQHAIDPAIFMKEQVMYEPSELTTTTVMDYMAVKNICLTGGEPMLQSNAALFEYVDGISMMKRNVEMFSNGTLPYNSWFLDTVTVCMDWKLPGSGDVFSDKWINTRANNLILMGHAGKKQSVKFTIANLADYQMAKDTAKVVEKFDNITIYFGAVWGKWTEAHLVEKMLEDGLPYNLNVQMHNYIWDRNKRGI